MKVKNRAFTLAEVLITLMIIGILAVITIPSILQSWEEQATVTRLKKIYSVLQQAYQIAEQEYGTPDTWGTLNRTNLFDNIVPYLPVLKNCKNGTGCMGDFYTTLDGRFGDGGWYKGSEADAAYNENISYYKILLKDNVSIAGFIIPNATWQACNAEPSVDGHKICAIIYADVNGPKPPNQYGRDTFWFMLTKVGFLPFNIADIQNNHSCTQVGYGCTRWIIERGNMDYLH